MKIIILAAGEGSRMRPLTYTRPKVMLPLANKPILEHVLLSAREAGIREFIFVVGYHDDKVRDYFGDGKKWRTTISYCTQPRQLGTADAIRGVCDLTAGESFLVTNGDIIVESSDFQKIAGKKNITIGVTRVANPAGLGVLEVTGDRVVRIHEKTPSPPSNIANSGLYFFTPEIFDAISRTPKSPRGEYEITSSLQLLIDRDVPVSYQELSSWTDLSYPWDLLGANEKLASRIQAINEGEVEPNVTLKGEVVIGKGTVVRSGSYIVGPVIIGESCDIGPNCFIRAFSVIGNGCHIGAATEVKNSIVMSGTRIPHHNYIGDSVIGEGCNLGAGTKTANLRLDKKSVKVNGADTGRRKLGAIIGDHVETGINVSINTGTMIGNNTFIGPGAKVSGVISPETRVF